MVAIIYSVVELSLSLFILEKRHHEEIDGFEIIAHDLNANDISKNVEEILAKKNKENIKVFLGSGKISHFSKSDFEKECAGNFKRYFEYSAQEDPLRIPWKIPENSKRIMNIMFQWCKDTHKVVGTKGLVLHSFSILKHAYQHGFTKEILQNDLKIDYFSESPISVVYNSHEGALLLLRKAESEDLAIDLALAFNDLKLFILLFHDVLSNSGMKVIPLVVTNKKVHAGYLDCSSCKNHVLSEEDFTSIKTFRDWWIHRSTYFETEYKGNITEASSKTFLAKLTGVLSAALLYPNYIPQFTREKNSRQHMEHLKVLLTPMQLDVYYSQEKHMVLKGGFGCGKSIIANVMLQKISESLKEDEKLFYVCHDPRSELLKQKSIKNKQEKVESIDNKKGRTLSAIIEDIKEKRPGKINLVVDEYDGEDLDESEAKKLNHLFNTIFKEAFILLIVQPIEKERVIKEIPQNKNRFDLLEETMGTPRYLRWNMRNSIEIHELIEATKKILSKVKTNFIHPEDNKTGDQLNSIKESTEETSFTSGSVLAKKNPKELEFKGTRELKRQSDENSDNAQIALDEAQGYVASSVVDKTGVNETVSSFLYAKVHKTGHQIHTEKPVLFELHDKVEFEKHLSLLLIFEKILSISRKQVVLHFETMTNAFPRTLGFAFGHYFREKSITTNYEKFESSEESILVCSYPTFRGLEHPIITILIDRDIYFVQHYLVEMIARCTSQLYIVVLQNSESLKTVTDEWKKELVDQWKTEVTNCPHQRNSLQFDFNEYSKIIRGIFSCKKYKELEETLGKFSPTSEDEANAVKSKRIAKEVIDKKR